MEKTVVNLRISMFRHRVCVWIVLFFLLWSFLPAVSMAQQPTATMSAVSGTVLVNGQKPGTGTVLRAGDVIETQAGASVVLELSDGTLLELGENTKIDLADLAQTATGARVSLVKLMWGWVRAKLSSNHQHVGSSFDIETPNALVGVKFSEPDIEVSYNPESVETVGIAHTVELLAKNLLTDEEVLVPVGSTVIIVGLTIKIVAGILTLTAASEAAGATAVAETETAAVGTASTGMTTGTKVALGVAAVAAAGGVAVAVVPALAEEEADESDVSFTGRFSSTPEGPPWSDYEVYELVQNGSSVTINYSSNSSGHYCQFELTHQTTGTVNDGKCMFYFESKEVCCHYSQPTYLLEPGTGLDRLVDERCHRIEGGNYTATFPSDENTLQVSGPSCIYPPLLFYEEHSIRYCVGTQYYERE